MSRRIVSLCLIHLVLATSLKADLAPQPRQLPKPPLVAPFRIIHDGPPNQDGNSRATIIIPQAVLNELTGVQSNGSSSRDSNLATIVAGLALAAAAVSLLFARKSGVNRDKAIVLVIFAAIGLVAFVLFRQLVQTPNVEPPAVSTGPTQVTFEIEQSGHEVILRLPHQASSEDPVQP